MTATQLVQSSSSKRSVELFACWKLLTKEDCDIIRFVQHYLEDDQGSVQLSLMYFSWVHDLKSTNLEYLFERFLLFKLKQVILSIEGQTTHQINDQEIEQRETKEQCHKRTDLGQEILSAQRTAKLEGQQNQTKKLMDS